MISQIWYQWKGNFVQITMVLVGHAKACTNLTKNGVFSPKFQILCSETKLVVNLILNKAWIIFLKIIFFLNDNVSTELISCNQIANFTLFNPNKGKWSKSWIWLINIEWSFNSGSIYCKFINILILLSVKFRTWVNYPNYTILG